MSFPIEDYEIKQPILVAKCVKIEVISVTLYERAYVRVSFYKSEADVTSYNSQLSTEIMDVYGEAYEKWGQDDSYLETLVFEKYGLVKRQETNVLVSDLTIIESLNENKE